MQTTCQHGKHGAVKYAFNKIVVAILTNLCKDGASRAPAMYWIEQQGFVSWNSSGETKDQHIDPCDIALCVQRLALCAAELYRKKITDPG